MRVIGIVGPSFCGSTVINYILGALPGVEAVGEAHWIRDRASHSCGGRHSDPLACPFTPEILAELRKCPDDEFYQRLGGVLKTNTLVVSDKVPMHYERFGWPDAAVVPFKDFPAHVESFQRRNPTRGFDYALGQVHGTYRRSIARMNAFGVPWVPIDMRDLSEDPEKVLRALTSALGLPFHQNALNWWEHDRCFFGGNSPKQGFEPFQRESLTPEQTAVVAEHPQVLALQRAFAEKRIG